MLGLERECGGHDDDDDRGGGHLGFHVRWMKMLNF